jgi:hypothetical protein
MSNPPESLQDNPYNAMLSRKPPESESPFLQIVQVYGAVTMNNSLALGVFLALVYFRGLMWDFSSEVRFSSVPTFPSARCPSPLPAVTCRGIQGTEVQHLIGTSKDRHKLEPNLTGPSTRSSQKFPLTREKGPGRPSKGPHHCISIRLSRLETHVSPHFRLVRSFLVQQLAPSYLISSYLLRRSPRCIRKDGASELDRFV